MVRSIKYISISFFAIICVNTVFAQCFETITHSKISNTRGYFTGLLDASDNFGAPASIGDIDGDGIGDLAIGAPGDDDGGSNQGAVWIVFLDEYGRSKSYQKISSTQGGFSGLLNNNDAFGTSVLAVGDQNNDGTIDIAVGAPYDDDGGSDRGAVYLLYLNTNGTVKSTKKISSTQGQFNDTIRNGNGFGYALGKLGDFNNDGVNDILIGSPFDDDGGSNRGAIWLVFLDTSGIVVNQQKISDTVGNFTGILDNNDNFGFPYRIGDLNNDGRTEIVVGVPMDDDGGSDKGAFYVLFLDSVGKVDTFQKVSSTIGGFNGTLANGDRFGNSICTISDLDNDGLKEILIGSPGDNDGGTSRGGVRILYPNNNGTVKGVDIKLSDLAGNFLGILNNTDEFGGHVTFLGDFNSDGMIDIAIGAENDDDGGSNKGAVWILSLSSCKSGCSPSIASRFEKVFPSVGTDKAHSVQTTNEGGFVICGTTTSGAGGKDFFIIKLDANADTVWSKTYGSSSNEQATSVKIIQTADSGFVLSGRTFGFGTINGGVYFLKVSNDGNVIWNKKVDGNSNEHARDLLLTSDKGFIVCGTNGYILKFDSIGNMQWSRLFSGGGNMHMTHVLQHSVSGNYLIAGNSSTYGVGGRTGYLIYLDSLGNKIWERIFDNSGQDSFFTSIEDEDKGFIVGGHSHINGTINSLLVKIDSVGKIIWSRRFYYGTNNNRVAHIQIGVDGGYILTGYIEGNSDKRNYIMKIDRYGNNIWSKIYPGNTVGNDTYYIRNLEPWGGNGYIFANYSSSFNSNSNIDIYLAKLNNCGEGACSPIKVTFVSEERELSISDPTSTIVSWGTVSNITSTVGHFDISDSVLCEYNPLCQLKSLFTTDTVCVGDTTNFMDMSYDSLSNVTNWQWYYGDGDSTWNIQNPNHVYSNPGTYNAKLIVFNDDTTFCTDTSFLTVLVNSYPSFSLGNDSTICFGDSIELFGAGQSYSHLWSTGSIDTTIVTDTSGVYWLNTSNLYCSSTDTIELTFSLPPNVNLGSDTVICQGDSINLSATTPLASYLWNDNSTDSVLLATQTGQYWVEVFKSPCLVSDSINILVENSLVVNLGSDSTMCFGDSIELFGTGQNYSHLWSTGSIDTTIVADTTGVYWLNTSSLYCSSTDTIELIFSLPPNVNLGSDTVICQGNSINLSATTPSVSYLWNDNSTDSVLLVTQTGQYWVEVFQSPCLVSDTIDIIVEDSFVVNLGTDTSLCIGESIILSSIVASGGTYLWNDSSTSPLKNVISSGLYWMVANSQFGTCQSSDSVIISFDNRPFLFLGNDTSICDGDSVRLFTEIDSAIYNWSTGLSSQSIVVYKPGTYILTVDSGACSISDEIKIDVFPNPIIDLDPKYFVCKGDSIEIILDDSYTSYLWSNGDSLNYTFIGSGKNHWIRVQNGPCLATDTFKLKINQSPDSVHKTDFEICENEFSKLDAFNQGAKYLWTTGEKTKSIIVFEPGTYRVKITNEDDCDLIVEYEVSKCDNPLVIPNTITPNNDGSNDTWTIKNINLYPGNHVMIFNPNGHLLFDETNYSNSWDGTYNGKDLPATVYYFILDLNNDSDPIKGTITLIREK